MYLNKINISLRNLTIYFLFITVGVILSAEQNFLSPQRLKTRACLHPHELPLKESRALEALQL